MSTTVQCTPCLELFHLETLVLLRDRIRTRLVQLSSTLGGRVICTFNGVAIQIQIHSFHKYMLSFPYTNRVYGTRDATTEYGFAVCIGEEHNAPVLCKLFVHGPRRSTSLYRHIVLLVDTGADGYHIYGLLLLLFKQIFPSLFHGDVIQRFITLIIIASSRSGATQELFLPG